MEMPLEYWQQRTFYELASAIGTILSLDESTKLKTALLGITHAF
jgi:hypothetical protein